MRFIAAILALGLILSAQFVSAAPLNGEPSTFDPSKAAVPQMFEKCTAGCNYVGGPAKTQGYVAPELGNGPGAAAASIAPSTTSPGGQSHGGHHGGHGGHGGHGHGGRK